MATIYKRAGSPYYWIKFKRNGETVQESTNLRWRLRLETKQAKNLCAERSLQELRDGTSRLDDERFDKWVPLFLEQRYKKRTFDTTFHRWKATARYLESVGIIAPRQVTYKTGLEYVDWRKKNGASLNTAIHEVKLLGLVLNEAMKRNFIQVNPCARMGLRTDKPKQKPEITEKENEEIREALQSKDKAGHKVWYDWMLPCYEIAFHQGCRLMETSVAWSDVDLERGRITFDAKGDNRFTTALHPNLIPFLKNLKDSGTTRTCILPKNAARYWSLFFKSIGKTHLCFHCTRVTVITRLARKGVPISQAMRFVSHANESIHQIYQRLSVDDLGSCLTALSHIPQLQSPGAPESKS